MQFKYSEGLLNSLTKSVEKFGEQRVQKLLEDQSKLGDLSMKEPEKLKEWLLNQASEIFNLSIKEIKTGGSQDGRNARMAIIHLVHSYSNCSYRELSSIFGLKNKRSARYFCTKCDEMLGFAEFYERFVSRYSQMKGRLNNASEND